MAKTIYVQDAEKYVLVLADALKKIPEFKAPEWAVLVKSGVSKQRPPVDDDFWHIRAASILRQLYIKGVVGVGKLRTRYGSKQDRGGKPDKFRKASGKIIRVILQQAEIAGLVEKMARMQFGRRLTQQGRDLLDSISVDSKSNIDLDKVIVKIVPKQDLGIQEDVQEDATEENAVLEVEGKNTEEEAENSKESNKEEASGKDAPLKKNKKDEEVKDGE
jgi:small subunit ribosomal protein S19e